MTHPQATGTRYIVLQTTPETTTAMGIVLQQAQDRPEAQIVSRGPRCHTDLEPGTQVILDWSRVGQIRWQDTTYYVVNETDIWAVRS